MSWRLRKLERTAVARGYGGQRAEVPAFIAGKAHYYPFGMNHLGPCFVRRSIPLSLLTSAGGERRRGTRRWLRLERSGSPACAAVARFGGRRPERSFGKNKYLYNGKELNADYDIKLMATGETYKLTEFLPPLPEIAPKMKPQPEKKHEAFAPLYKMWHLVLLNLTPMKKNYGFLFLLLFFGFTLQAQVREAPDRQEGDGPYNQLIIRGVTLINGNGAPPRGPIDIVVEGNRIKQVEVVGNPGVPINPEERPQLKEGGRELDCEGLYLLPGFVDLHGHIGGKGQGADAEYVFKLWMGHGITTIRDPASSNGLDWVLKHRERSAKNEITAPRIYAYTVFGQGSEEPISTPEQAREWVRQNARNGADGIKFFGAPPDIMAAALDENKKLGLRSACHHAQMDVARWNVVHSARAGLTSMEHWYGLPEALFADRTVQDYPLDYNYQNEQQRFKEAGRLWKQAAPPYSDHWNKVMDELLALDFTIDPTFNIYEASRDLHRTRRLEWHEQYTMPSLWRFYMPSRISHGSYWHYWGTEEEVAWKENYRLWMTFINEYKNRGGRVTAGSDSGFIYQLYGFAYIRELELLREAGFHPLEVIRSATLNGAEALGADSEIGTVEVGKLADFVIVEENPLQNLKVLYGTGAIKLMEDNSVARVGGVKYTIKDGIIYDAKQLLADVREMVKKAKEDEGYEIKQPGME